MIETWIINGITEAVDRDKGSVTFWVDSFHDLQTAPIDESIPDWVLEVGAHFNTKIPRQCVRDGDLSKVVWGEFTPTPYSDLSFDELWDELGKLHENTRNG